MSICRAVDKTHQSVTDKEKLSNMTASYNVSFHIRDALQFLSSPGCHVRARTTRDS